MSIPSELQTVAFRNMALRRILWHSMPWYPPQCHVPEMVRVFHLSLWCHRSSRSWCGHSDGVAAGQKHLFPRFSAVECCVTQVCVLFRCSPEGLWDPEQWFRSFGGHSSSRGSSPLTFAPSRDPRDRKRPSELERVERDNQFKRKSSGEWMPILFRVNMLQHQWINAFGI